MRASVLLVDDDESSRVVLAALLEDEGFQVDVAASFGAAGEKLAAESASYDLVLLDQNLGDGRGTELLPALRARLPNAKAVLISGDVSEGGGARPPPDVVLSKGVDFPALLSELERLLR